MRSSSQKLLNNKIQLGNFQPKLTRISSASSIKNLSAKSSGAITPEYRVGSALNAITLRKRLENVRSSPKFLAPALNKRSHRRHMSDNISTKNSVIPISIGLKGNGIKFQKFLQPASQTRNYSLPGSPANGSGVKNTLTAKIQRHFARYKMSKPFGTTVEYYQMGQVIGTGAFGKVVLGVHKLTSKKVAIKVIDKANLKDEYRRNKVKTEIKILTTLRHPNIVKLLEVFESSKHVFIVMEYGNRGDLLDYVRKKRRITETDARTIFGQLLEGAQLCHEHGILHRDFKLDNILLHDHEKRISICDFGVSRITKPGEVVEGKWGTPAYIPPEIIADKGYTGFWSDIWSLGVILYTMVVGAVPFKANSVPELYKKIFKWDFDLPNFLSDDVCDLISKMIRPIPQSRISANDALDHPWLNTYIRSGSVIEAATVENDIVNAVMKMGYPRVYITASLEQNSVNHATAAYYLLQKSNS